MLLDVTITYLMITDNILILYLLTLLTLGTKGKWKKTCFEKAIYILYSHLHMGINRHLPKKKNSACS